MDEVGAVAKSILCKVGLHQWYSDGAMVHSVKRCDRPECDAVSSKADAEALERERQFWTELVARNEHSDEE